MSPRSMVTTGPTLTSPNWAADFLSREHLVPGGAKLDAAQFLPADAVVVVVSGPAAAAATSIPVNALSGPIPNGTVLDFGTNKFARLTAAAAAGATTLTVAALPTALVANDTATYRGTGKAYVNSGTPVGRTIAERDASTPFGPAVDTDAEVYLVAFDVVDVADINDVELVRPRSTIVKENYLPDWTGFSTALKDKIRATYICVRGAE